jgi:hypothetical protein
MPHCLCNLLCLVLIPDPHLLYLWPYIFPE